MGKKIKKTHYLKICPECGSNGLERITRNNIINTVTYSKHFICCIFCGYEKEYKKKGEYSKDLFEDD